MEEKISNKKLKLGKAPISAFSHQAALLSVLCEYPVTYDWIFSNYIQIYTLHELWRQDDRIGTLDFFYHFYGDFNFGEYLLNPWINFNKLSYKMVRERWGTFLKFVKEQIENEQYVYMILNRSIYREDENWWFHPVLIWGYDDANEVLYCADNNSMGKFDIDTIPYEKFELATDVPENEINIGDHGGRMGGVCSFSILTDMKYHELGSNHLLQIEKIKYDLKNYIEPYPQMGDYVFGINCYNELMNYYESISARGETDCDMRALCSLYDHKILMKRRIQYLSDAGRLNGNFGEEIDWIIHNFEILKNMLIKANINNCKNFPAEKINFYLDKVKKIEIKTYGNMIENLR